MRLVRHRLARLPFAGEFGDGLLGGCVVDEGNRNATANLVLSRDMAPNGSYRHDGPTSRTRQDGSFRTSSSPTTFGSTARLWDQAIQLYNRPSSLACCIEVASRRRSPGDRMRDVGRRRVVHLHSSDLRSTGIDRPVVLWARWDAATAAMSPGSPMSRDGLLSKPGGPGSSSCAG